MINIIKKYEGLKLVPYICPGGKLTIGYGRNLEDNGISEAEANTMLENDIDAATKDLGLIFYNLSAFSFNRFVALVDMMFNLGHAKFSTFKKMIAAIKKSDWEEAADQAKDSRWYNQVGQRAIDNVDRLRRG